MRADGRSQLPRTTYLVRTMAVDGTHAVGRALDVLSVYNRLGCDAVGVQETRRGGHSAFTQAGYLVHCSDEWGWREWWEERARWNRTSCENLHHASCRPPRVYQ